MPDFRQLRKIAKGLRKEVEDKRYKLNDNEIRSYIDMHTKLLKEADTTRKSYSYLHHEICNTSQRVVVGAHGPYLELVDEDFIVELEITSGQEWRLDPGKYDIKYLWMNPVGIPKLKVYKQLKRVQYADYKIDHYYIDFWSLEPTRHIRNRKYTPSIIDSLENNEVFVFGSNATGFHGAGAAGLAFRGEHRNTWRQDKFFLKAMKAPVGHSDRIGKWAIFGIARGYQRGTEGASYAIQTIVKPGLKRSVTRREIYYQLLELSRFALQHPELTFLVTKLGCGLAGYTEEEIKEIFKYWCEEHHEKAPDNIILPQGWDFRGEGHRSKDSNIGESSQ